MSTLTSSLLAYLLNSLWQVPLVFLSAALLVRLTRRCAPAVKHRIWVGALLLETVLPAVSFVPAVYVRGLLRWLPWTLRRGTQLRDPRITVSLGSGQVQGGFALPQILLTLITMLYAATVVYFLARLLWAMWKTHVLSRTAHPAVLGAPAQQRWERYERLFRVPDAAAALTSEIAGPVTVGVRHRVLLLPEAFTVALPEEDQDAALAHEFAHMKRRDFAKNLAYQILSLPIAYHPMLRSTAAHLAETREMVCDALAAEAVAGPERYARSLLRLASALLSATPTSTLHAIGIFDANTLERRIMSLRSKRSELHSMQRLAIGATALALVLGACGTAMALRMRVSAPAWQNPETSEPAAHVSSGIMAGNILTKVNPVYPEDAKEARVSGTVVLGARIGKDGTIQSLRLISGPPELTRSAWDAVKQWTYKPYLLNGEPVEVDTTITVNYTLAD